MEKIASACLRAFVPGRFQLCNGRSGRKNQPGRARRKPPSARPHRSRRGQRRPRPVTPDQRLVQQVNGGSAESFIDTAGALSGCSIGARNLLCVHGSVTDPLWFALFARGSGKLAFVKWTGDKFEQQVG